MQDASGALKLGIGHTTFDYQCLFSGGKIRLLDEKKGESNVGDLKSSGNLGDWQSCPSGS